LPLRRKTSLEKARIQTCRISQIEFSFLYPFRRDNEYLQFTA
jgi:hypothetical protein